MDFGIEQIFNKKKLIDIGKSVKEFADIENVSFSNLPLLKFGFNFWGACPELNII